MGNIPKNTTDPTEQAIALGIANQLVNILRDVGEDARRGRIYIPLEDLALFNYTEADLINQVVDERWRELMRFQIQRHVRFTPQQNQALAHLAPMPGFRCGRH